MNHGLPARSALLCGAAAGPAGQTPLRHELMRNMKTACKLAMQVPQLLWINAERLIE
jgi:hypothetical protein